MNSTLAVATRLLVLLAIVGSALSARAQSRVEANDSADPTTTTRPSGPLPQSLEVDERALQRARSRAGREKMSAHLAIGKRLFEKGLYARSAREFALAYAFEAQPGILIEIARACRRAEFDSESLGLYLRLQKEQPASPFGEEIQQEITVLDAKLDDPEFTVVQMFRERADAARRNFQAGLYAAAAEEYALAYAINPFPRLLFNTAQAYRRASQHDEAYILYSRFLEEDPQSPLKKESLGYMRELRLLVFRPPVHKRAWFWGVLGLAATAVVATTAAVATTQPWVPRVSLY